MQALRADDLSQARLPVLWVEFGGSALPLTPNRDLPPLFLQEAFAAVCFLKLPGLARRTTRV